MDADDVAHPRPARPPARRRSPPTPPLAAVGSRVALFPRAAVRAGMNRYAAWLNGLVTPDLVARDLLVEAPLVHPASAIRRDARWRRRAAGATARFPRTTTCGCGSRPAGAGSRTCPARCSAGASRRPASPAPTRRYALERHVALKCAFLARHLVAGRTEVALWGAGRDRARLRRRAPCRGRAGRALRRGGPQEDRPDRARRAGRVVRGGRTAPAASRSSWRSVRRERAISSGPSSRTAGFREPDDVPLRGVRAEDIAMRRRSPRLDAGPDGDRGGGLRRRARSGPSPRQPRPRPDVGRHGAAPLSAAAKSSGTGASNAMGAPVAGWASSSRRACSITRGIATSPTRRGPP